MAPEHKLPDSELVSELIQNNRLNELGNVVENYHPADIADLLEDLPSKEAILVFGRLPVDVASEVLDETGGLIRQELVEKVDDEILADLLDELPMDDAAEFLEDLPDDVSDRLLDLMEPEEAKDVRQILSYEDETAGRLMTRDVAALRRQWTVNQALDFLRNLPEVETVHYLYVVDQLSKLIGVVPIRNLLMAQPNQKIQEIMLPSVYSVPVTADQEEIAEIFARYDYVAIPVVDHQGRLLGVITVDDAMDALEEEVTEDIQRLGGSEPLDQPYFAAPILQVVRKRMGWLMLLFVAANLSGAVYSAFQDELGKALILASFTPLIMGTGGNAGSQTVATIIRAITLGEVRLSTLLSAWRKEVTTGLILGILMGSIGVVLGIVWGAGWQIGVVVGLTLPIVIISATTIATLVPTIANHYQIDPTVVSGPMITTIVDSAGLAIYFLLAKVILGL
ncbi:MAG: magnesium transporter [Ardenticatenaceae bacterium]|nr:magnesium transporter [Ardenticatenaceae bacterium]